MCLLRTRSFLCAIGSAILVGGCQPPQSQFAQYGYCEPVYAYDAGQRYASQSRARGAYFWQIVQVVGPEMARLLARFYGKSVARYLIEIGGACLEAAIEEALANDSRQYITADRYFNRPNQRSYRYVARR